MNPLGNKTTVLVEGLERCSLRHRLLAENLANVNTPGYRAKALAFDRLSGEARIEERTDVEVRADGNSVSLERENAEMEKNALLHRVFLLGLTNGARQMRAAIDGRGS